MMREAAGQQHRTVVEGEDGDASEIARRPDPYDEYAICCSALLGQSAWRPPVLEPDPDSHPSIPLEDLVEAGVIDLHEAPPTVGATGGDTPMLSAKDVRLGRAPSRWGDACAPGAIEIRVGDIAVAISTEPAVRVCTDNGVLLGPGIRLVRADSDAIDPYFLAGILRAAVEAADGNHIDIYEVAVPRIPLAEQHRYGKAFEQLTALEAALQRQRANIGLLVRTGFGGLAQGKLRPVAGDE
ncbi:hypothetical protein [Nocardia niigatensis]|uniref:hypothetical protein n=1 Tax=Nocardia niigatensis TaxID=209249 RepID=UPI00031F6706|nr:hypothetical protein [Nocardia niigatensis]